MKSTGYVAPHNVEKLRRFGTEVVLGLDDVQARLVKILFGPANDLNARRAALNTLGEQHSGNPAVATILKEHWEPLGECLREPEVVAPVSPR